MASQSLHKKPMASALNQAAPEELLIFVIQISDWIEISSALNQAALEEWFIFVIQRSDWVEIFKFSVFILLMIMVCKNRLL